MPSLFIASLGNPPPKYHNTLHSAGHILLRALAVSLDAAAFTPNPTLAGGLSTETYLPRSQTRITLWQSPTLMNVSGSTLVRAYKAWLAQEGVVPVLPLAGNGSGSKKKKGGATNNGPPMNLILVHDELQLEPGQLKIRRGGAELSSRGHNGIKSVVASLVKANLLPAASKSSKMTLTKGTAAIGGDGDDASISPILLRVGIGIGRPVSREPNTVADYVLKNMSGSQLKQTCAQTSTLLTMLENEMSRVAA